VTTAKVLVVLVGALLFLASLVLTARLVVELVAG
jgi:hypothetical protein